MGCVKCGSKPKRATQAKTMRISLDAKSAGGFVKVGAQSMLTVSTPDTEVTLRAGQLTVLPRSLANELKMKGCPIWIVS